jgi:hypothetical protein
MALGSEDSIRCIRESVAVIDEQKKRMVRMLPGFSIFNNEMRRFRRDFIRLAYRSATAMEGYRRFEQMEVP